MITSKDINLIERVSDILTNLETDETEFLNQRIVFDAADIADQLDNLAYTLNKYLNNQ